jgi:hypothetical protein
MNEQAISIVIWAVLIGVLALVALREFWGWYFRLKPIYKALAEIKRY